MLMDKDFIKALNLEISEVELEISRLTVRRNALEALRQSYNSYNAIPTKGLEADPSTVVNNTWEEPSARDQNTKYTIIEYMDGHVTCSCPGFHYRGECKHVW